MKNILPTHFIKYSNKKTLLSKLPYFLKLLAQQLLIETLRKHLGIHILTFLFKQSCVNHFSFLQYREKNITRSQQLGKNEKKNRKRTNLLQP